jgi:hypothetical protein
LKILLPQKKQRPVVLQPAMVAQPSVPQRNVYRRISLSAVLLRVPVWVANIFPNVYPLGKAHNAELF